MKMKTYGKYVIRAAVAALGILLFYLSALAYGNLISETEGILFYLEQPLGIREALEVGQRIEEDGQEMPKFCIWGQRNQETLTNEYLKRSVPADVILLSGNPELLFEDCRVPAGKDSRGCLIDEDTAWELFGSANVEGKEISYQGKPYTVRKVIPGRGKIFALQICSLEENSRTEKTLPSKSGLPADSQQPGENISLNRITMQKTEEKSLRDLEIMWNAQYGLSVIDLDMELLRGIGGVCVLLLPATSCIYFLVYLFYEYRKQKHPACKAVAAALGFILATCFFLLLKSWINIPDDYIPTKWSDFSFWTELWGGKQEAVKLLFQMPKTVLDIGWMASFGKTLVCGLLAEALAGLWKGIRNFY